MSPFSELKEKFECVEYIGKVEKWVETSPLNQENFLIQISSWIPGGNTAKLQWLEHLWNHENIFETGVV